MAVLFYDLLHEIPPNMQSNDCIRKNMECSQTRRIEFSAIHDRIYSSEEKGLKIKTLKVKNFRGYKDETVIDFENFTVFVGKNDVGKSTILEALDIFFNDGKNQKGISVRRDHLTNSKVV